MSQSFCIFCGKIPGRKTREHVLPQWLLKLTGNDGTKLAVFRRSIFNDGLSDLKMPFSRFTFPACDSCNSGFAQLEAKAGFVMEKLLSQAPLLASDFDVLLDWFDKVRRGMWLADYVLTKNPWNLAPTKFIADLIGQEDRALIIHALDIAGTRLIVDGPSLEFSHAPISFLLIVNNLVFLSISYTGLCSRRLGFPFIIHTNENSDGTGSFCQPVGGTSTVVRPILPYFDHYLGLGIYQPCFGVLAAYPRTRPYTKVQYVKNHALLGSGGRGLPFLQTNDTGIWSSNSVGFEWSARAMSVQDLMPVIHQINYSERLRSLHRSLTLCPRNKRLYWKSLIEKVREIRAFQRTG